MAPADTLSPAGSSTYNSDTISVGDGTWDFTKNTFLLPPLQGVNFDTMLANGMAQRFSTMPEYHKLVKAHGVIAAITFLFLVPIAVLIARFHKSPAASRRYHAYMQVLAIGLSTVIFVLGYFAVGPARSLTNPHHAIGVAIYTLILVQGFGGQFVKNIRGRSLRGMLHRWFGRVVTLLGIVQVPLGLTLYGSPKYLFILYALWMSFLVLLYFILSYKRDGNPDYYSHGGYRSEVTRSSSTSSGGGGGVMKWIGPLAAMAGLVALFKGRGRKRSSSPGRSSRVTRSTSRDRSSRRTSYHGAGSESFYTDDKYSGRADNKKAGFFSKILGMGAAAGGAALLGKMLKGKKDNRTDSYRDEYSTVEHDTPPKKHYHNKPSVVSAYSDETDDYRHGGGRRTPLLPPPVQAGMGRPTTPRPSHRPARPGPSTISGVDESDYSSYITSSPSKNKRASNVNTAGKGILAGLGLGWFTKKATDRADKQETRFEDERRHGVHGSRYTGDGHSSPSRRASRRYSGKPAPPAAPSGKGSTVTYDSDFSSALDPRPAGSSHAGPPMPPYTASSGAPDGRPSTLRPTITPIPAAGAAAAPHMYSRSRQDIPPATMPSMPDDPHGVFSGLRDDRDSDSDDDNSVGGHPHRRSSRRRRAAAQAIASASRLAQEQEDDRRRHASSIAGAPSAPSAPVSVSLKMHQDRDRTVTLRQLKPEEREHKQARASRRRTRTESMSSLEATSDSGAGNSRRYRRESRGPVDADFDLPPPAPPPAGQPPRNVLHYMGVRPGTSSGPAPGPPPAATAATAASSTGNPDNSWSPSASQAAAKRKQRRADRRKQPPNASSFEHS